MLLADLVAASDAIAATPARNAKVALLADVLRRARPEEPRAAVGFLTGDLLQGKIGVGWATVWRVEQTPAATPSLELLDLDATVTELAALTGPGSGVARGALLGALFGKATEPEGAFIRRLLVGELRQGALHGLMADAVAKASGVPAPVVRRAVMLTGDLGAVAAAALAGGAGALAGIGLQLLRPVLPMLASTATGVAEAIAACGESSIEWKLDGARVQVHRAGGDVRIFTRNLNDVTERLPVVAAAIAALPCDRLILDGEAIGMAADERPELFQHVMSRFGRHDGGGGGLGALFFDCLHIDGADLLDEPLATRLAALERVAPTLRIPGTVTADLDAATRVLDDALAAGHEGVMVKSINSLYEAGRRGKAWRKVKPVLTLDLVVLAAEWGHGRRRGRLSNLHLGARDPAGGFVMVGKTFKGLTDKLLEWQTAELESRKTAERGIVVEVRPELVVEIALDGVHKSSRYPGGVALRFARVRRYRPDKSPAEADTIDAVRRILQRD